MSLDASDVKEAARGRWPDVIATLVPELRDAIDAGPHRHVPCPRHGGKDGLRVLNDFAQTGGVVCNTCGTFADGFATLEWTTGRGFADVLADVADLLGINCRRATTTKSKPPPAPIAKMPDAEDAAKRRERLVKTWQGTTKDSGKIAAYLRSRGLSGGVPPVLRLHSALPYYSDDDPPVNLGTFPAMVAKVQDAAGLAVALHRTYLDPDEPGRADVPKPKKAQGPTAAAAVRLADPVDVLAVSEGIETGLCVLEATGTPTYAALSAVGLKAVVVPPSVKRVEVWADNDASGTGQQAAEKAAARLHAEGREVVVLLPPDVGQDWLDVLVADGPGALKSAQRAVDVWTPEVAAMGGRVDADPHLPGAKKSTADKLVELGRSRYHFGQSLEGDPYGVPKDGPRIARLLRGHGGSLRADLAAAYVEMFSKTPTQSALADAVCVLEGLALRRPREPLHVRHASHEGAVWIDLGDATGRAVQVTANGWTVETSPPVLFRRSALTGVLPEPVAGDLREWRRFLNVTDEAWALVAGCAVSTMHPAIPHPVLAFRGEQGSAKTTTARQYIDLVDPSAAPLRSAPRDVGEWVTVAAGSAVVGLDNVSNIPPWFSDALCRAVTGDGFPRRALYSDGDIIVTAFRRAVVLNGIDMGALSGDLVDRAAFVELQRIPFERRRLDSDLARDFAAARPALFGGLLDLVSATLYHLPAVRLAGYPRMADHAKVLAALDMAADLGALPAFLAVAGRAFEEAVDGDQVAAAVRRFAETHAEWSGELADLLKALTQELRTPDRPPKGWPPDAARLSGRLMRSAPALRAVGVAVELGEDEETRHRTVTISREKACKTACEAREACDEQAMQGRQAEIPTLSSDLPNSAEAGESDAFPPSLSSQAAIGDKPVAGGSASPTDEEPEAESTLAPSEVFRL